MVNGFSKSEKSSCNWPPNSICTNVHNPTNLGCSRSLTIQTHRNRPPSLGSYQQLSARWRYRCALFEKLRRERTLCPKSQWRVLDSGAVGPSLHHGLCKSSRVLPTPLTSTGCKTSRFPNAAGAIEKGFAPFSTIFTRREQFVTHGGSTRYDSTPKNGQCKTLQTPAFKRFCTHGHQK